MAFKCEKCERVFVYKRELDRHVKNIHEKVKFSCEKCGFSFTRKSKLTLHLQTVSGVLQCNKNIVREKNKCAALALAAELEAAAAAVAPTRPPTSSLAAVAAAAAVAPTRPPSPPTSSSSAAAAAAAVAPTRPPSPPTSSSAAAAASTSSTSSTIGAGAHRFCTDCKTQVSANYWSYHLRTNVHKRNSGQPCSDAPFKSIKSVFNERIETLFYENVDEGQLIPDIFLQSVKVPLLNLIEKLLIKHISIKLNIELFCEYIKMVDEDAKISIMSHQTKMRPFTRGTAIAEAYTEMCQEISTKMSEFQERDSGWTLIKILHMEVNVNQYTPIAGSSYILLPAALMKKRACINVQNSDSFCFKWAIISALIESQKPGRCNSYNVRDIRADIIEIPAKQILLNFSGLSFPLPLKEVKIFEGNNPSISVNVFGYDKEINKIVGPYYVTKDEKRIHINLLLLQHHDRSHYVWIKSLSR